MSVLKATVADDRGSISAVWFNQPWVAEKLQPGRHVRLRGQLRLPARHPTDPDGTAARFGDDTALGTVDDLGAEGAAARVADQVLFRGGGLIRHLTDATNRLGACPSHDSDEAVSMAPHNDGVLNPWSLCLRRWLPIVVDRRAAGGVAVDAAPAAPAARDGRGRRVRPVSGR